MKCTNCGNEILPTDKYCGICGEFNPLSVTEEKKEEPAEVSAEEKAFAEESAEESETAPAEETEKTEEPASPQTEEAKESAEEAAPESAEPAPAQNTEPPRNNYAANHYGYDPARHYAPAAKPEKVKRTCSLSAVVFCGIVIFILSVLCGIFAGLYIGKASSDESVKKQPAAYVIEVDP